MQISIVVPTFRRNAMLEELLDAVLAQRASTPDAAIEVIVVDNCPDGGARATVERRGDAVRYVAERTPGVVHARNAGVRAARGRWVLFVDDDETPQPGWLDGFLDAATWEADAVFGRKIARFEAPAGSRKALLERLFARWFDAPNGASLNDRWPELSTGNAMFLTGRLDRAAAFDPRFNRFGGEDSRLIRQLIAAGARMRWLPCAAVEEIVPAKRMTPSYMRERRFNQGRLRCRLMLADGVSPRAAAQVAFWMAVGGAQAGLHGAQWVYAHITGGDTALAQIKIAGGLGKVFWWMSKGGLRYDQNV